MKKSKQGDPIWPEFLWEVVCGEEIQVYIRKGRRVCAYREREWGGGHALK